MQYVLAEPGNVKLEICNVLGQSIITLTNEQKPAGQWDVVWDGRDGKGSIASSGIYIARLQTKVKGKTEQLTAKLMIQK